MYVTLISILFVTDRNYGTASSLLETSESDNWTTATLSPDSCLEQLHDFMRGCKGPYGIGTDGGTVASQNLLEVSPFNMYSMKDFLSSLDKDSYPSLRGLVTPWPITGRARSMTPMHLEDLSKSKSQ